jgi:hypothetical protein
MPVYFSRGRIFTLLIMSFIIKAFAGIIPTRQDFDLSYTGRDGADFHPVYVIFTYIYVMRYGDNRRAKSNVADFMT